MSDPQGIIDQASGTLIITKDGETQRVDFDYSIYWDEEVQADIATITDPVIIEFNSEEKKLN